MRIAGGIRLGPGREFALIRRLVGSPDKLWPGVEVGPGDDCAVLEGGLVASVDITVEDVHFRRSWVSLEEVGYRATAAGLSDLAAMAAEPLGVLISLALAPEEFEEAATALQRGASAACFREGIGILGGDLSGCPGPLVVDVVALGRTETPLLRTGSRPGDEVWVTGFLGTAAAAVSFWEKGRSLPPGLREAFSRPEPRIREILWLKERAELHAGIDISDGLAGDVGHLAAASEMAFVLETEKLPFSPDLLSSVENPRERIHFALRGGEDYELCLTAAPGSMGPLAGLFEEEFDLPLTRVGRVLEGNGVSFEGLLGGGDPPAGGFDHFEGVETA